MPLTFVVGMPRSGGTMLARVLNLHPDVLCVNEFITNLTRITHEKAFPISVMNGAELWKILESPYHLFDVAANDGVPYPELCYPYGIGRFDPASGPLWPQTVMEPGRGVPIISHMTLPVLTDDPDALFDRLAAEVPAWPARPAAEQYRALFGFLAGLLGRTVVVERSSTSLGLVPLLRALFPEARFVHMHRNGPDCALALSRHPLFRLAGLRAAAARNTGLNSWEEIQTEWRRIVEQGKLPKEFSGLIARPFNVEWFMSYDIPLPFFGGMWSRTLVEGLQGLTELPADSWTSLAYEDLLESGEAELTRLAGYLGVAAPAGWLDAASQLIAERQAGTPQAGAADLDPGVLAALERSCEQGTQAIRATGRSNKEVA
jgi:hypothetical protein